MPPCSHSARGVRCPPPKKARVAKRKAPPSMGREVVHIKVGSKLIDFGVHKDLLVHYSPHYFKPALTGGFQEATTGVMELPETAADVFELFVHWLYHQVVWDRETHADVEELKEETTNRGNEEVFLELYIFADMARIPSLMNLALDDMCALFDTTGILPFHSSIAKAWENVYDTSPLRRFLVDYMIWEGGDGCVSEEAYSTFPKELNLALMQGHRTLLQEYMDDEEPPSPLQDLKKYHVSEVA